MLVYGVFVLGILFLVYKSNQQKFDLVQKDYYAEELKYQNVIDATQKAKALGGELKSIKKGGHLIVALPEAFHKTTVTGTAHLYYAADEHKDITKEFVTTTGELDIELLTMMRGAYTLKLNVAMNGEQYYYEQKIYF
ncbi:MAG: hypothetical protein RLZ56_691 [Bacteroidota bacterium]